MEVLRSVYTVISKPYYLLLAAVVALIVFSLSVWLPNLPLIFIVIKSSSLMEVLSLLFSLYGAISTNFTFTSALYTILIAALFGVNVSLLTYYIRKMRGAFSGLRSTGVAGIGGLISGVFGIGCAACGTFIFTSVLTMFGIGGLLAYLPFGGEEFGFLGVGLLLFSAYSLTKKINAPLVC